MNTAMQIIKKLGLEEHPNEGGFFKRTYTATELAYFFEIDETRAVASAIYYLLSPTSISRFHKLKQDEIWHFYAGDQVDLLLLSEDGSSELISFGNDVLINQLPQVIIPKGTIFGARLKMGGEYALFGATLTPEFHYEDYSEVSVDTLLETYPKHTDFIKSIMSNSKEL